MKGFGFTLIAIKVNTGPLSNGRYRVVVRHMITDVAKFGAAAEAGIKKDDLINAVNSQRTAQLTHQQVVDLIRTSEKQVSKQVHTHYTGSYTLYRFIHTIQVYKQVNFRPDKDSNPLEKAQDSVKALLITILCI